MTLAAGTRLGPYEIQGPLGAGGVEADEVVGEPAVGRGEAGHGGTSTRRGPGGANGR